MKNDCNDNTEKSLTLRTLRLQKIYLSFLQHLDAWDMDIWSFLITLRKISFEKSCFLFLESSLFLLRLLLHLFDPGLPHGRMTLERLTSSHWKHWGDAFCLAGIVLRWTGWYLAWGGSACRGGLFSFFSHSPPLPFLGPGDEYQDACNLCIK